MNEAADPREEFAAMFGPKAVLKIESLIEVSRRVAHGMVLCTFVAYDSLHKFDEESLNKIDKKVLKVHADLMIREMTQPGVTFADVTHKVVKRTMFAARAFTEDFLGVPRTDGTETGSVPK